MSKLFPIIRRARRPLVVDTAPPVKVSNIEPPVAVVNVEPVPPVAVPVPLINVEPVATPKPVKPKKSKP